MNDTNSALNAIYGPIEPVNTFSMVPMWVRATGEYKDAHDDISQQATSRFVWPWGWTSPRPPEQEVQARAAIKAMQQIASQLAERAKAIELQAQLLEQSLQSIETAA